MGNRSSKLNVTHTLSTDGSLGNLNAASVADNTFITDFLILDVYKRQERYRKVLYALRERT